MAEGLQNAVELTISGKRSDDILASTNIWQLFIGGGDDGYHRL